MKKKLFCTACVAIVAILGSAGCATSSKDERSEGRALDDKNISEHVRKALDEEPVYKFGNVEVKTFSGEVQLSGFVNTEEQKRRAGDLASQIRGVMNVHNNLVMKPLPMAPTGRTNTVEGSRIYSPTPRQEPNQQAPTSDQK